MEKTYESSSLQGQILEQVAATGADGLTAAEARAVFGKHHGAVSGAMSVLHATGKIERLSERRSNYKIYIDPAHVGNRRTESQGRVR